MIRREEHRSKIQLRQGEYKQQNGKSQSNPINNWAKH